MDADSVGTLVRRCSIRSAGVGLLDEGQGTVFERNAIEDIEQACVVLGGTGGAALRHKLKGEPGIVVTGDGNLFERNRIKESAGDAIALGVEEGGSDNLAPRNRGIRIMGPGGGHLVLDNTVKGGDVAAIASKAESAGNLIVGNRVKNTPKMGIHVIQPGNTFRSNRVRASGGALVSGLGLLAPSA